MKMIELTGKKFGRLKVLGLHSKTRNGATRWECLCDCGKKKNVLGDHLRRGKIVSCGCYAKERTKEVLGHYVGEISGNYWYNHVVRSANGDKGRRKPIELSITKEYAWNLFLEQKRKCALSGILLFFPEKWKSETNASLDRIDSSFGYINGNVQWVHKDINMMKRIYDNDYFIKICKLIAENCAGGACEIESMGKTYSEKVLLEVIA